MPAHTIAIFGSGPGIGNNVAATFASKGFTHIILLARNSTRLSTDADFVRAANPNAKVSTLQLDLSDLSSIPNAISKLDSLAPSLEVIFFNAARIQPTAGVLDVSADEIAEDFRTTNLSLYVIAQHYLPKLEGLVGSEGSRPSLLVTNSHLPWDPVPQLLSLSLVKASQANMVKSFFRVYVDKGVHVGLVNVEGSVAPENKVLNSKTIAEKTWDFFERGEGLELSIKE